MAAQNSQKINIGYFVSTTVAEFVFIGGAMVTDRYGLPIEFRYTEPVRANRLQRILYGDVLERYIHSDVILTNLLERMENIPSVNIVSDASYIPVVSGKGSAAIWIGETRAPQLTKIGEVQESASNEFLLQLRETGSPIRVKTADNSPEARQCIVQQLVDLSETMDLIEPLHRIESAIALLWEESSDNTLTPIVCVQ
jgi:hypothetical protein